jgi:hypothetical protein
MDELRPEIAVPPESHVCRKSFSDLKISIKSISYKSNCSAGNFCTRLSFGATHGIADKAIKGQANCTVFVCIDGSLVQSDHLQTFKYGACASANFSHMHDARDQRKNDLQFP